jgi:hypothetical protein
MPVARPISSVPRQYTCPIPKLDEDDHSHTFSDNKYTFISIVDIFTTTSECQWVPGYRYKRRRRGRRWKQEIEEGRVDTNIGRFSTDLLRP